MVKFTQYQVYPVFKIFDTQQTDEMTYQSWICGFRNKIFNDTCNNIKKKKTTYPWAQFYASHLTCQHKFYEAFFNWRNPAKPHFGINPAVYIRYIKQINKCYKLTGRGGGGGGEGVWLTP